MTCLFLEAFKITQDPMYIRHGNTLPVMIFGWLKNCMSAFTLQRTVENHRMVWLGRGLKDH